MSLSNSVQVVLINLFSASGRGREAENQGRAKKDRFSFEKGIPENARSYTFGRIRRQKVDQEEPTSLSQRFGVTSIDSAFEGHYRKKDRVTLMPDALLKSDTQMCIRSRCNL